MQTSRICKYKEEMRESFLAFQISMQYRSPKNLITSEALLVFQNIQSQISRRNK